MNNRSRPSAPMLDALGLDIPIVQAPMAGAGGLALAQSVQAAGALGSLPCAMLTPAQIEAHLKTLNANCSSNRAFNVNFFTHPEKPASPDAQAHWQSTLADDYRQLNLSPDTKAATVSRAPFNNTTCELIEQYPPAVVSFHFGLPQNSLVQRVKAAGCQVWSSATTVAEARWLEAHGADAIIAQGFEAGGHRGLFLQSDCDGSGGNINQQILDDDIALIANQVGTLSLVPQVVDAVSVPVIAAGGIGDGRGMAAALALGATAVQIGTAFLFTTEATITPMHRKALLYGCAEETALTNVFSGKPARSAVNHVMRTHGPMSRDVPPFPTAAAALAPLKAAAEEKGQADYSSLWSGQSAQLTARLIATNSQSLSEQLTVQPPTAAQLLQWIADDAKRTIANL